MFRAGNSALKYQSVSPNQQSAMQQIIFYTITSIWFIITIILCISSTTTNATSTTPLIPGVSPTIDIKDSLFDANFFKFTMSVESGRILTRVFNIDDYGTQASSAFLQISGDLAIFNNNEEPKCTIAIPDVIPLVVYPTIPTTGTHKARYAYNLAFPPFPTTFQSLGQKDGLQLNGNIFDIAEIVGDNQAEAEFTLTCTNLVNGHPSQFGLTIRPMTLYNWVPQNPIFYQFPVPAGSFVLTGTVDDGFIEVDNFIGELSIGFTEQYNILTNDDNQLNILDTFFTFVDPENPPNEFTIQISGQSGSLKQQLTINEYYQSMGVTQPSLIPKSPEFAALLETHILTNNPIDNTTVSLNLNLGEILPALWLKTPNIIEGRSYYFCVIMHCLSQGNDNDIQSVCQPDSPSLNQQDNIELPLHWFNLNNETTSTDIALQQTILTDECTFILSVDRFDNDSPIGRATYPINVIAKQSPLSTNTIQYYYLPTIRFITLILPSTTDHDHDDDDNNSNEQQSNILPKLLPYCPDGVDLTTFTCQTPYNGQGIPIGSPRPGFGVVKFCNELHSSFAMTVGGVVHPYWPEESNLSDDALRKQKCLHTVMNIKKEYPYQQFNNLITRPIQRTSEQQDVQPYWYTQIWHPKVYTDSSYQNNLKLQLTVTGIHPTSLSYLGISTRILGIEWLPISSDFEETPSIWQNFINNVSKKRYDQIYLKADELTFSNGIDGNNDGDSQQQQGPSPTVVHPIQFNIDLPISTLYNFFDRLLENENTILLRFIYNDDVSSELFTLHDLCQVDEIRDIEDPKQCKPIQEYCDSAKGLMFDQQIGKCKCIPYDLDNLQYAVSLWDDKHDMPYECKPCPCGLMEDEKTCNILLSDFFPSNFNKTHHNNKNDKQQQVSEEPIYTQSEILSLGISFRCACNNPFMTGPRCTDDIRPVCMKECDATKFLIHDNNLDEFDINGCPTKCKCMNGFMDLDDQIETGDGELNKEPTQCGCEKQIRSLEFIQRELNIIDSSIIPTEEQVKTLDPQKWVDNQVCHYYNTHNISYTTTRCEINKVNGNQQDYYYNIQFAPLEAVKKCICKVGFGGNYCEQPTGYVTYQLTDSGNITTTTSILPPSELTNTVSFRRSFSKLAWIQSMIPKMIFPGTITHIYSIDIETRTIVLEFLEKSTKDNNDGGDDIPMFKLQSKEKEDTQQQYNDKDIIYINNNKLSLSNQQQQKQQTLQIQQGQILEQLFSKANQMMMMQQQITDGTVNINNINNLYDLWQEYQQHATSNNNNNGITPGNTWDPRCIQFPTLKHCTTQSETPPPSVNQNDFDTNANNDKYLLSLYPTKKSTPSTVKTSSIAIIIGVIFVVIIAFIVLILLISYCRKNGLACFGKDDREQIDETGKALEMQSTTINTNNNNNQNHRRESGPTTLGRSNTNNNNTSSTTGNSRQNMLENNKSSSVVSSGNNNQRESLPATILPTSYAPAEGDDDNTNHEELHLPPGWQLQYDASSNKRYYLNLTTMTSQWRHPAETDGDSPW